MFGWVILAIAGFVLGGQYSEARAALWLAGLGCIMLAANEHQTGLTIRDQLQQSRPVQTQQYNPYQ